MKVFKKIIPLLNFVSAIALTMFLMVLLLESAVLIMAVPMVSDNIINPHISTESDIIMDVGGNADEFNHSFSISPYINGTFHYIEGHVIFVPEKPMKEGVYHLSYLRKSINFRTVKPDSIEYNIIKGFDDHVVVLFNMKMNRSSVESLISIEPELNYSVTWYGNTMIITPASPEPWTVYHVRMDGNVSALNGDKSRINLNIEYVKNIGIPKTEIESSSFPDYPATYTFFILPPGIPVVLNLLKGSAFLGYYLFIVTATVFSLGYIAVKDWKNAYLSMKKLYVRRRLEAPSKSMVLDTGMVFFAVLSFTIIYYLIVYLFTEPTVPQIGKMSLWLQLYELARAGVWEELITRIPFIGIPLLLIHILRGKRLMPVHRYILGGNLPMDRTVIILITLCAFMFGFVHMIAGWDAYKILPAMVAGMGMGYLYAKWGIWASITLHFAIDYLSMPSLFFNSQGLDVATGLFILFGMAIGLYFLILYAYRLGKAFLGYDLKIEAPTYETYWVEGSVNYAPISADYYIPSTIPYAPYPYRCYSCGNTEAEYMGNGLLRCTRCGSLSRIPPFSGNNR